VKKRNEVLNVLNWFIQKCNDHQDYLILFLKIEIHNVDDFLFVTFICNILGKLQSNYKNVKEIHN
jgi:uncharacterized protein (DUF2164 family)